MVAVIDNEKARSGQAAERLFKLTADRLELAVGRVAQYNFYGDVVAATHLNLLDLLTRDVVFSGGGIDDLFETLLDLRFSDGHGWKPLGKARVLALAGS